MADFVAVLKKTIDGLDETDPDVRRKVYDKARTTIAAKLGQMNPAPPPAVAERQKKALEDAILQVEADYKAAAAKAPEPVDELESIFASLSEPKPPVASPRETARPVAPSTLAIKGLADPEPLTPLTRPGAQQPVPPPSPKPDPFFSEHDRDDGIFEQTAPTPHVKRRSGGGALVAVLVLIVLAGAAYGAWLNRAELSTALGVDLPQFTQANGQKPAKTAAAKQVSDNKAAGNTEPAKAATAKPAAVANPPASTSSANPPKAAIDSTASPAAAPKFTERLAADGTESNPGPAGGESRVGEGTSVASATPAPASGSAPAANQAATTPASPGATPNTPAPNASETKTDTAQVPVGQRAIFYEERTNTEQGSAETGSIVWSLVKESPGGDLPPEDAIRGEATIPGKNLQLRMTIRRNGDKTLPASFIVELIFLTPNDFEGGGIDSVLRMAMKDSEQAPGSPLIGIPAKIADGYFLLALNDGKAEIETNTTLLRRESWVDIPIVYKSGRRALITLEKGVPGDKVFQDALNAWQQTPIGQEKAPASGDTSN